MSVGSFEYFAYCFFFFQAEDGIRDGHVTGVQTCALPILVPRLQEEKYSNSFIASVIGPAGVLGLIIPPSITMVILGITANISIGSLFIAGEIGRATCREREKNTEKVVVLEKDNTNQKIKE